MTTEQIVSKIIEIGIEYGPKLIGAIIVWIIGSMVISFLGKSFIKMLDKRGTDASLKPFFKSLFTTLLKVLLVISVLGMVGVEVTSFIAILGAAGLAVGLALSGTLQNFAGGVMILLFKPFKVGDLVEASGYTGFVKEIQIFNTVLLTPDNVTVIIPNGGLSGSSVKNFSAQPLRRVDLTFGIGYGDSVKQGRDSLMSLIQADDRILSEPAAPFIALKELGDSSVNLVVRLWVNTPDYWGVYFDMNEKVYNKFTEDGLNIPFPQMDVHLHQEIAN